MFLFLSISSYPCFASAREFFASIRLPFVGNVRGSNSLTPLHFFICYRARTRTRGDTFIPFCRMIVFVQNLRINTVQLLSRKPSKKLPSKIQCLLDGTVFLRTLTDVFLFKFLSKRKVFFIDRGKFVLSDNRCQISCVPHFCVGGKQLVCQILMILPCVTLSDSVFHQTGQGRQDADRRINGLTV